MLVVRNACSFQLRVGVVFFALSHSPSKWFIFSCIVSGLHQPYGFDDLRLEQQQTGDFASSNASPDEPSNADSEQQPDASRPITPTTGLSQPSVPTHEKYAKDHFQYASRLIRYYLALEIFSFVT